VVDETFQRDWPRPQQEVITIEIKTHRNMVAILRVLRNAAGPLGAERIAQELEAAGTTLSERAVRGYLAQADSNGWTENLGRRGRRLTTAGRHEFDSALVIDKVGFVAARVDTLAYQMTFDPETLEGTIILNVSTFSEADAPAAIRQIVKAYQANLGMGRKLILGRPGEKVGSLEAPADRVAVGTLCSVSINGVFQRACIPTRSRFGGLLQMEDGQPKRFTQIINYDGTSLDPLEIFIRGHMTSVGEAARTGSGIVGASFREVPTVALPEVRRLARLCEKVGLGGLMAVGLPNHPLLEIPVAQGCVGVIVCGGLNPIAAVVESGIGTTSAAMHSLCNFSELADYTSLQEYARELSRRRRAMLPR